MSERPTDPEDETPGPEVTLTRDQFDALARWVPKRHLSVRLWDRGDAYVEAELLDAEGSPAESRMLFPLSPKRASWQAHRRWLRRRDEEEEQR